MKVNEIYAVRWGWEQTNWDFFRVLKATAKTVVLARIKSRHEATPEEKSMMLSRAFPVDELVEDEKPLTRRYITDPEGEVFVRMGGDYDSMGYRCYNHLNKWVGTPFKASHYA